MLESYHLKHLVDNIVPVNSPVPVTFSGSLVIWNNVNMFNSRMPCWPNVTVNGCRLRAMWDDGFKLFGGKMNATKIQVYPYVSTQCASALF
jgi:hypothetical protein